MTVKYVKNIICFFVSAGLALKFCFAVVPFDLSAFADNMPDMTGK